MSRNQYENLILGCLNAKNYDLKLARNDEHWSCLLLVITT